MRRIQIVVKLSAIAIGALAVHRLSGVLSHWKVLLFSNVNIVDYYFKGQLVFIGALQIVAIDFIPLLLLISFWGVLQIKAWGRLVAIITLSIDFFLRGSGAVKLWTMYWFNPELRAIHQAAINSALKAQQKGELHVVTVSFWPSYIICVIDLLLLIVLFLPPVKKFFNTYNKTGKIKIMVEACAVDRK